MLKLGGGKKIFKKIKLNSGKNNKKISLTSGAIIILIALNIGLLFWMALLTRQLHIVSNYFAETAEQYYSRYSEQQKDINSQNKKLGTLAEPTTNNSASNAPQIYTNDIYKFTVQYPKNWTYASSTFDPETIAEFYPKLKIGGEGTIKFTISPEKSLEEAAEKSLLTENKDWKLSSSEKITINGFDGLEAFYKNKNGQIFAHYFFKMADKIMEGALDSDDRGYKKVFEDMVAGLEIK
ncbi:MAG: hypothetical protein PHD51_02015 [Patescibacteria group bacterium]|nr:hypothetical protein [Patescibacteria group bacterium]MDD5490364.1 hypothetical protein [Patescibacteria group bacterium]